MAEKTNFGTEYNRIKRHKDLGSPDLSTESEKLGTILDIRMPSRLDSGSGMQCQIAFDNKQVTKNWYTLEDDYMKILATIGDREAVKAAGVRVIFRHHPSNPNKGIAKIICDNRQEESFKKYESNQSIITTGAFQILASNKKAPGL